MRSSNCDAHPLLSRMGTPEPKRPPDMQDKRSVVPIEAADVDAWLFAPVEEAASLMRLASADAFEGEPVAG